MLTHLVQSSILCFSAEFFQCQYTQIMHHKKKIFAVLYVFVVCVLAPISGEVRSKEHGGVGHCGAAPQMDVWLWVDTMAL